VDPNQENPTYRELFLPQQEQGQSNLAFTSVAISEYAARVYVAAGSLDGRVRVWNATTGGTENVLAVLDGHEDSVYGVKFLLGLGSNLGVVSGSVDRTVKRWELEEGGNAVCVKTLKGHKVRLTLLFAFFYEPWMIGCRPGYVRRQGRTTS